jgi:hypothetical protein
MINALFDEILLIVCAIVEKVKKRSQIIEVYHLILDVTKKRCLRVLVYVKIKFDAVCFTKTNINYKAPTSKCLDDTDYLLYRGG